MPHYPILNVLLSIKDALRNNAVTILKAPPGAGKSTVLPLELLGEKWLSGKKIIMLEPRRLAAKTVASRMADQLNDELGKTVGYRIRFESKVSPFTKLEVVTEGILTRLIQSDNALEDYGLVILDEFHERSLNADLALAFCLQIQQLVRPDIRILIMSATLEDEKISAKLFDAPVIKSDGKRFPLEFRYQPSSPNKTIAPQVASLTKRAFYENSGDVLVFLPGAGEINRVFEILAAEIPDAEIFKLYGDLNFREQQQALLPIPGKRKIILATSIAETSITIEGIKVVVDSGLSRSPRFDPRSGLTKLETIKVTKDSADQRAGRAGRLGPGVCYRLWSEHQTNLLQPTRKPEILESDLTPLMLELFNWGIQDIEDLVWIDSPPKGNVASAVELLIQLDAIDSQKRITAKGKSMCALPTHPRISHMLLEAKGVNETALLIACDLAALLEERDPLANQGADLELRIEHLQRLRNGSPTTDRFLFERIDRVASYWRNFFQLHGKASFASGEIHKYAGLLIAAAYPERIAKQFNRQSSSYKLANGRVMKLEAADPLNHFEWLAIAHADSGVNDGKIFLAAPLKTHDLINLQKEKDIVKWDDEKEMAVSLKETWIGGLVLKSKPQPLPDQEIINMILFEQIQLKGLKSFGWSDDVENLQARTMCLKVWREKESWPDVSEQKLISKLQDWLSPFLSNIYKKSDLVKLDWHSALKNLLTWEQQNLLDKLAPTRIEVPSGSSIKINYFMDGRPPELHVRLQELFGLADTPAINEGSIKLMIHLLSPAYRPVQVTQDLKSFWNGTYHEVRKELRSRYPKHSWPEDPWSAQAVRGVKKIN